MQVISLDPHFHFHFANGYEDEETNKLVIDMIRCDFMTLGETSRSDRPLWEDLDYAKEVPYSRLERYTVDLSGNQATKFKRERIANSYMDFPVINPAYACKKVRSFYIAYQ